MPATVIETPLGISCVFSDGRTAEFYPDGSPRRELLRGLLFGLFNHGFTLGAAELRRGQLIELLDGDPGLPMGELR